ncbi:hypothetical protein [Streptosporangium sp. NPDC003464]
MAGRQDAAAPVAAPPVIGDRHDQLGNARDIRPGGEDQAGVDHWLGLGADLISFGRAFIANHDLVERLRQGLPIMPHDESTWYEDGDAGYLTYTAYRHTA